MRPASIQKEIEKVEEVEEVGMVVTLRKRTYVGTSAVEPPAGPQSLAVYK